VSDTAWVILEWSSAVLAGTYTFLAAFEKRIGWVFAFVSSLMTAVVFYHRNYTGQVVLNLFYVVMAVYGWISWGRDDASLPITRRKPVWHAIVIAGALVIAALGWFLLRRFHLSESPAMDAWVTVFSVLATWMMARKLLENWIYWCLVDGVAITLYVTAEPPMRAYALLFSSYVVLSAIGWWRWSRALRTAADPAAA
jgi:nicotinamide mononucleotide transporter